MTINADRLWNNIHKLGEIGRTAEGGITRLSFTETEKEAKETVKGFMAEAGLKVWEDEMGNLYGRREGRNPELPAILIGSHIDSVFNGGIFDGPAGVLTGIEVLHSLNDQNVQSAHPVEVVAFTDEEGARFSSGMLGSKAITGTITDEDLYGSRDADGLTVADAMKLAGFDEKLVHQAKRNPADIKCYLELHIEQGKVLEKENLPVGIVTGIVGVSWLKVTLEGEAGHAGTTPMNFRKDPLTAAASIIDFAEKLGKREIPSVITVGRIQAFPGGINIIPGKVEFTFDIRDLSDDKIDSLTAQLKEFIASTCEERGISFKVEELHKLPAALCSPAIKAEFAESLKGLSIQPFELPSGAGHDAMIVSEIADMGMIFVRSKDGISHNPKEWSEKEDLAAGAEVMYETVKRLSSPE